MFVKIQHHLKIRIEKLTQKLAQLVDSSIIVNIQSSSKTLKTLEAVWDFAYDRVGYLGTNTPIDKCYKCDFEGDFTPTERGFMCPNCGNTDPKTVDVVKRTCGYLGNPQARPMVKGRHKEISARVKHMNGSTIKYEGKHL